MVTALLVPYAAVVLLTLGDTFKHRKILNSQLGGIAYIKRLEKVFKEGAECSQHIP